VEGVTNHSYVRLLDFLFYYTNVPLKCLHFKAIDTGSLILKSCRCLLSALFINCDWWPNFPLPCHL